MTNYEKACEMASQYAKTKDNQTMSELNDFCCANGIFLCEDTDRIYIEDDYFIYRF